MAIRYRTTCVSWHRQLRTTGLCRTLPDQFYCLHALATNAFGLQRRRQSSHQCYLHRLRTLEYHTLQSFYGTFSGTTRLSRCHKKASSGLHGAKEDNKRQTHRQSGWEPLHPDQSAIHLHQSPIFMPDALPAATLPIYPGLGQAQEYAGLHTPVAVGYNQALKYHI